MEYAELAEVYEKLEATPKRLEKTAILAKLLRKTPADSVEEMVLLLQGRVYPAYDEREVGVASKLMARALMSALGVSERRLHEEWKRTGDLGITAERLVRKRSQSTLGSSELTVRKVFATIRKIAEEAGSGSVERKLKYIAELVGAAKPLEARYAVRTILEDLRVGVGAGAMRDAIVWAHFPLVKGLFAELGEAEKKCRRVLKVSSPEDAVHLERYDCIEAEEKIARQVYRNFADTVQQAYDLTSDFGVVAKTAKTKGLASLEHIEIRIGTPIKVMLALKADGIKEALATVGVPAEAEYKFDGFRMQIHRNGKEIRIFTRRLEDVTAQFPDVVEHVRGHVRGDMFILDAEAVGFDPETRRYLPFQRVSQRIRRKYGIVDMARKLPVEVNVFDAIAYNGRNLIGEPFRKRRERVEAMVDGQERKILPARKLVTDSEEEVKEFFAESQEKGNEGIMIKNLDAPYKPGARVGYMLKYKSTMENLDLAIVGAEWGEGKRAKWLSSFDLACRKGAQFADIGKVATGLKEKSEEGLSFEEMTVQLKPLIIAETGKHVRVNPDVVMEVAYEEIQKSPTYSSGYALRFPRVVRLRDDKGKDDVSTLRMVEKLYEGQRFRGEE